MLDTDIWSSGELGLLVVPEKVPACIQGRETEQTTGRKSRREKLLKPQPRRLRQEEASPEHHGRVSAEKGEAASHTQQGQGPGVHGSLGQLPEEPS